jgi:hypothetical protein
MFLLQDLFRDSLYSKASNLAGMTGTYPQWDGGLANFLLRLALNLDPPNLCLLRNWDYRHELLYLPQICSWFKQNKK